MTEDEIRPVLQIAYNESPRHLMLNDFAALDLEKRALLMCIAELKKRNLIDAKIQESNDRNNWRTPIRALDIFITKEGIAFMEDRLSNSVINQNIVNNIDISVSTGSTFTGRDVITNPAVDVEEIEKIISQVIDKLNLAPEHKKGFLDRVKSAATFVGPVAFKQFISELVKLSFK